VFQGSAASAIAFVGTTGSAVTYIAGCLSGIVADRFGYRQTAFVGTVIMAASLVLASFSKQVIGIETPGSHHVYGYSDP